MNLIIDIGNTSVKWVVFHENAVVWRYEGGRNDVAGLAEALQQGAITASIMSAVAEPGELLLAALKEMECPVLKLTSETPIPIENGYSTPCTLGSDRLAAVVGAHAAIPDDDVLVIDMGTCITYDLIDGGGIYRGGNIAPGMRMRFESMHRWTEHLPLVQAEGEWPREIGHNTVEALRGGVLWGIVAEVEHYINFLRSSKPKLKVILTGGDAHFFENCINKDGILMDDLLVARGLNRILAYNEN